MELFEATMELIRASERGDVEQVTRVLDQGVDVDAGDVYGQTSLVWASEGGHIEIVDLLVRAGANVDVTTNNGNTPLIIAVSRKNLELVKLLLEAGANTEITCHRRNMKLKDYTAEEAILKLLEDYQSIPDVKEPECE